MQTKVKLPQWGMGMREGEIVEWFREVGDDLKEGDDLVEVEAEKVTGIVESPRSGRLVEILAQAGEQVPVRSVIAVIEHD